MNVLIVGLGGIGCRHLQGCLSHNESKLKIWGIDIDADRIKSASIFANSIQHQHQIKFDTLIPEGIIFDVAIIATNAFGRKHVLDKIASCCNYIIVEKFLFNKESDYLCFANTNNIFVNCPRRAMNGYIALKNILGTDSIFLNVSLPNGFLSNSIHFIDLFCFLKRTVFFESKLILSGVPYQTKRKNYWDSFGSFIAGDGKNSLIISSTPNSRYVLRINDWLIDEENKKAYFEQQSFPFLFNLQSELTGKYLSDIIADKLPLTAYVESADWHLHFLQKLRRNGWTLPIT